MEPHHGPGAPSTARAFRDALGRFATGVTVVTCHVRRPGRDHRQQLRQRLARPAAGAVVAGRDPRAAFDAFTTAAHFAIHVMAEDQRDLARAFVRDGQALDGFDWKEADEGTPLIHDCLARFDCAHHAVHDGGDHAIVVGRVLSVQPGRGAPLLFAAGRYGRFAPDG